MARKYPQKDIKLLYGKAAGICAFPDCRAELILGANKNDSDAQIGKIAHIVAHSTNGPRADNKYPSKNLDTYENWILLCPTCHDTVDIHHNTYTVEFLRKLKKDHEIWVRSTLQETKNQAFNVDDLAPNEKSKIYLDIAVSRQIAELQKALTGKIEKQLQYAREQIRRKEGDQVDELLISIVEDNAEWTSLTNETKSAVKRLMGSRALHKNDIGLAKQLCSEAEIYDPTKVSSLKALIALMENGIRPALKLLENVDSPDALRLRAGLHISLSDIPSALEDLNSLKEEDCDGEALRLYALANMVEGNRAEAFSYITRAQENYADWYAVQHSSMMMYFHASYSPVVVFQPSAWPNPIISEFVREDSEGQEFLKTGLQILEKLKKKAEGDKKEQNDLNVWHLAYLSNLKSHSLEAETYANEILKDDPSNAGAITWCLARGYNFDAREAVNALVDLIQSEEAEYEHVLSLAGIYLMQENKSAALTVLENNKKLFNTPELKDVWKHWYFKSSFNSKSELPTNVNIDELIAYKIQQSVTENNWAPLAKLLEDTKSNDLELAHIFIACWNFAISKNWIYVAPYIYKLIEIQTAEAVRLAVWAAYNNGKTDDVLKILDENTHVFSEQKLPADLRRLHVRASNAEGNFYVAVEESKRLSSDTNDKEDRLGYIENLLYIGDTQRAAPLIRDTLKEGQLTSVTSLQLSNVIEGTDPSLARQLLENVEMDDLPSELAVAFYGRALKAGLAQKEHLLHSRLEEVAATQPHLFRKLDEEEFKDFIENLNSRSQNADNLYKQGNAPIHVVSGIHGVSIAELVFGNFSSQQLPPKKNKLLFRFAGRGINVDLQLENISLYLDITSAFVAYRLGILPLLEEAGTGIFISPHLPQSLIEMENDLRPSGVLWIDTLKEFREFIADKLRTGLYKGFSQSDMADMSEKQADRPQNNTEAYLYDLVRLKESDDRVIWSDDRHVNKYHHVNNSPIIDTYDILNLLLVQGYVDDNQYYNFIIQLRKANYFYIPLTEEEIIYHLKAAKSEITEDQETEALKTLRQYQAMLVVQEEFFNINAQDLNAYDEKKFLFSLIVLAKNTILAIWCDKSLTVEQKQEFSVWVWDALRVEYLLGIPIQQPNQEGRESIYILNMAGLLVNVLQVQDEHKSEYIKWIDAYIYKQMLSSSPQFKKKIGICITNLLESLFENTDSKLVTENDKKEAGLYLSKLVTQFPNEILEEVFKSKKLVRFLGTKLNSVVNTDGKQFLARDFWRGISNALKKGQATIRTSNKKSSLKLYLHSKHKDVPAFRLGAKSKEILADDVFSFLVDEKEEIKAAFQKNLDWFEYPNAEQKKLENKIIKTRDHYHRAEIIEKERQRAPAYLYARIEDRLERESSLKWDELSPAPIDRLLHHLCLRDSNSKNFNVRFEKALDSLIKRHGIEVAFRYCSGLPINMPEQIIDMFKQMDKDKQNRALEYVYNFCYSPLRLFHFIYLLQSISSKPQVNVNFQDAIIRLQKNGLELCDAFKYVLNYFEKVFFKEEKWVSLNPEERCLLCWYHSDQITNLLIGYGMPLENFYEQFQKRPISHSYNFLLSDAEYRKCPYTPSNIEPKRLFFNGLSYAFGEHPDQLLSEETRLTIKEFFISRADKKELTDPWIMQNNFNYTPAFPSFLVENHYNFGNFVFGDENLSNWLKIETIEKLIIDLKKLLQEDPQNIQNWLNLSVCCQEGLLPEDTQDILELTSEIDFYELFKNKEELTPVILRYLTISIHLSDNSLLLEKFRNSLLETVKKFSLEHTEPFHLTDIDEDNWVKSAAVFLADSFIILDRKNNLEEALNALSKTVLELCETWPAMAPMWRKMVNSLIKDVGFKASQSLWEAQIKLRTFK